MLEICLLALFWMSDPGASAHTGVPATLLQATCVRPVALVSQAGLPCASIISGHTSVCSATDWLERWKNSTNQFPDRSRSEREEFRRSVRDAFNEHAVAAAELLVGRVDVNRLNDTFNWRIIESSHEWTCLEAVPKDDMERLFFRSLRMTLDAKNGVPKQLVIIGRNQPARTVWKDSRIERENSIELVHFENEIPPSPKELIRTADSRVELRR